MLHCNCHYIRYIDYVSVNLPLSYAYHITAKVGITITMFIVYVGTTYIVGSIVYLVSKLFLWLGNQSKLELTNFFLRYLTCRYMYLLTYILWCIGKHWTMTTPLYVQTYFCNFGLFKKHERAYLYEKFSTISDGLDNLRMIQAQYRGSGLTFWKRPGSGSNFKSSDLVQDRPITNH